MQKRYVCFLTAMTIVITLACSLGERPTPNLEPSLTEPAFGETAMETPASGYPESGGGITFEPSPDGSGSEVLAYFLENPETPGIELHFTDPDHPEWDICLTCKLPEGSSYNFDAAWSPDHGTIAMTFARRFSVDQDALIDLYVVDVNQGRVNVLQTWDWQSNKRLIGWSPDSLMLLLLDDIGLHMLDISTGTENVLKLDKNDFNQSFTWLDDQTIAYIFNTWEDHGNLYTITVGEETPRLLAKFDFDISRVLEWSPDRKKMLVEGIPADGPGTCYGTCVLDINGAPPVAVQVDEVWNAAYYPHWSPDSREIAFVAITIDDPNFNPDPNNMDHVFDVYVMDVASGSLTRLTNSREALKLHGENPRLRDPFEISWSPSGGRLALDCPEGICVINADGTGMRTIVSIASEILRYLLWK